MPGAGEIAAFYQSYLKAFGLDEAALTPGLMQAGSRYEAQLKQIYEEMKKVPGEPVSSTIEIKIRDQGGPSAGEMLGNAAMKELAGKLPIGMKTKGEGKEPAYEERIKFKVTTELIEASIGSADRGKYEVPAGYKLVKMER